MFDEKCAVCGEVYDDEELIEGICAKCLGERYSYDFETCYEVAKNDQSRTTTITINGFLAEMFKVEEIEEILLEHLDECRTEAYNCQKYIDQDRVWFAKRLKKYLDIGE